jgi:hypothetical protein
MSASSQGSKQYWKLLKRFPLRPIRTDDELDMASELFSELGLKGDNRTQDERLAGSSPTEGASRRAPTHFR